MNKTAIIGIVIAIIVAGIVGIYTVSNTQDDSSVEAGIGLSDKAEVTIEEDTKEVLPGSEESIGLGDKAEGIAEEPEEEPPNSVEVTVKEGFGVGDNP